MSERPKDGGPAFPNKAPCLNEADKAGMSLRDWFAGQALAGLVPTVTKAADLLNIGRAAYNIADAMIAAREARHD